MKQVTYSKAFNRDVRWYFKMRHLMKFAGDHDYSRKEVIIYRDDIEFNRVPWKTFKEAHPTICGDHGVTKCFDGEFHNYKLITHSEPLIVFDKEGVDGVEAFYNIDARGIVLPTKHSTMLETLLRTKASVNLHIKMYAEDLATQNWNKLEMRALCIKFKAPFWFREAIENQRIKIMN